MTKFEIKVALLGHASVGKTSVLNALFKDKCSEMGMGRSAGNRYFRVKAAPNWCFALDRHARAILRDITKLNTSLRDTTKTNHFEVTLMEPLFPMRDDTELTIIDVPGLNITGSKYREYVQQRWETFDCVVVVLDVRQQATSQTEFLKLMAEHMKIREIPLIILCNKVDEPDAPEMKTLFADTKRVVAEIFPQVPVIPISARNAFVYGAASRLKFEDFKRLDKRDIDEIGKEECGRYGWRDMNEEAQYQAIFRVAKDRTKLAARISSCNFGAVLRSFKDVLGSVELQTRIIERQLALAESKVTSASINFAEDLRQIFLKLRALGKPRCCPQWRFWPLWGEMRDLAFEKFKQKPAEFVGLHRLSEQLAAYVVGLHRQLHERDADAAKADLNAIVQATKDLVQTKCAIIVEASEKWTPKTYNSWFSSQDFWAKNSNSFLGRDQWYNSQTNEWAEDPQEATLKEWGHLSLNDWSAIVDSICVHSQGKIFREHFSPQFAALQRMIRVLFAKHYAQFEEYDHYAKGIYNGPQFTPCDPVKYKRVFRIAIPEKLSDPLHWGHLERKVCEVIKELEATLKHSFAA